MPPYLDDPQVRHERVTETSQQWSSPEHDLTTLSELGPRDHNWAFWSLSTLSPALRTFADWGPVNMIVQQLRSAPSTSELAFTCGVALARFLEARIPRHLRP